MNSSTLYAPLIPTQPTPESPRANWGTFPGSRRPPANHNTRSAGGPPAPDKVLLKTGGNALQAVPREAVLSDENRLMAVSVPIGLKSGDRIRIAVPDGSGRLVEAVVPPGAFEGHTFLVRIPDQPVIDASTALQASLVPYGGGDIPEATAQPAPIVPQVPSVPGRDAGNMRVAHVLSAPLGPEPRLADHPFAGLFPPPIPPPSAPLPPQSSSSPLSPTTEVQESSNSTGTGEDELVLVQVPPGALPGTTLRVQLDDGRLLEATIPEGGGTEFFVRVPTTSNSDNSHPRSATPQQGQPQSQSQNWHDHPLALCPMALP